METTKIKVDEKIKPVPFNKRKSIPLTVGKEYYVSFGLNEARLCRLTGIIGGDPKKIKINIDGGEHVVFADEIGQTPEEAVMNQATF